MYYGSLLIVGTRCEIKETPELWKNRCGNYSVINKDKNKYYIKSLKLAMKDNYLTITYAGFIGGTNELLLSPLNDTEAIIPGLGFNETIYITKDKSGNEIINLSGFKFKKDTD